LNDIAIVVDDCTKEKPAHLQKQIEKLARSSFNIITIFRLTSHHVFISIRTQHE